MNERKDSLSIPGFKQPETGRHTGGQPTEEQLRQAAGEGLSRVINLRPETEEHGFDEPAVAQRHGLQYHCLPISGPDDLTRENAQRLHELLERAGEEETLIHCASGNRVGALMALRAAWLEGRSVEDALEIGRHWGLTKMEPAVVRLLQG